MVFYRVLILGIFVPVVTSRLHLFDAKDAVDTRPAKVSLRESGWSKLKRDSGEADLHLTLSVGGRVIKALLKRTNVGDFPVTVDGRPLKQKRNWAIYTSDDVNGHFLVHKRDSGMTVEGYLVEEGASYLVQPSSVGGGHVIHTLSKHPQPDVDGVKRTVESRLRENRGVTDDILMVEKGVTDEILPVERGVTDEILPVERRVYGELLLGESGNTVRRDVIRNKRRTTHYTVEMYAVFDKAAYELVQRAMPSQDANTMINMFYAMHTAAIDRMLATLDVYGVDVSVRSAGLDIRTSDIVGTCPTNEVKGRKYADTSCLLKAFRAWMNKRTHLKYDYAVLYTGYRDKKGLAAGWAFTGGICAQKKNYGLARFGFGTEYVRLAGHELGHSLGAAHTFEGETVSCQYENTIMNYGNYSRRDKEEYFTFSTCAAREISDFLSGKRDQNRNFGCLYETSAPPAPADDEFLGQDMTRDEQCKYMYSWVPYIHQDPEHEVRLHTL